MLHISYSAANYHTIEKFATRVKKLQLLFFNSTFNLFVLQALHSDKKKQKNNNNNKNLWWFKAYPTFQSICDCSGHCLDEPFLIKSTYKCGRGESITHLQLVTYHCFINNRNPESFAYY